jgi:predicted permease
MTRTLSRVGALLARFVSGLLLLLYPADFRETFGLDIRGYLSRQGTESRYAGMRGRVRFLIEVLGDAIATGFRMRWRKLRTKSYVPTRRTPKMENLLQDLKFGAKLLWKEKALTLTVLLTLAVCVGANTAIYSVIDTVLLEPLPYPESDRLVRVFNSYPNAGAERSDNSAPDYFFRRERVEAFDDVAAYYYSGNTVGEPGSTERISSMRVTASFFPTLGVQPLLGRTFAEEETEVGNANKVILSNGFWRERFGSDPGAAGQELRVDSRQFTIVGVLPEDFHFLGEQETRLYLPIPFRPRDRTVGELHNSKYEMIARLRAGATIEQATSQIAALDLALGEEEPFPDSNQILQDAGYHVQVHGLRDDLLRDIRASFILLWIGVAFVLLIGCVNIANLMLARANVRMRELATRIALGADRKRLSCQLITEAVLIALLGGLAGLGVGAAGLRLIHTFGVDDLPRASQIGLDGGAVLFTVLVALAAGIFFGAIPLFHIFRTDLNSVFRAESRSGTASGRTLMLRSALATAQVSIAFILLIGAGLMFASLQAALSVDPGFQPGSVLTGYLSLPDSDYPDGAGRRQLIDDLLRETRALPGVTAAGVTSQLPFGGGDQSLVVVPEGYTMRPGESYLAPWRSVVGPGYLETLQIPLREGRYFEESDDIDAQQVMIIDQWLAERYFPNESPLGKRMLRGSPGSQENEEDFLYTIIGVVGIIKQNDLTESEHAGAYYFTYKQMAPRFFTLAARTSVEPLSLTGSIREAVARVDPDLPFYYPETMDQRVSDSLVVRRTPMLLLSIFAVAALFLAAVGLYGVLAYSVTQRTRELGIRLAMGSNAQGVFRLVVSDGLRVLGIGLVIGLVGALALVRLIRTLLFGVQVADPAVLAAVAVLLIAVGLTACIVPAVRATRIDPVVALNSD